MPYKITRETKLQSFQYRVLFRLITCKRYLHTIHMSEDDKCVYCGAQESITHFLVACPSAQDFWGKLDAWCQTNLDLRLPLLSKREIVLGITNVDGDFKLFKLVNWILLTARFYLHRQKLFHKNDISLIAFLAEARNKLIIEKMTCSREGKPKRFKVWEKFLKVLSP